MKKIFLITLIAAHSLVSNAQIDSSSTIKAGWGLLDYSVPESPALKLLGTNSDNILRPTSVRNIAVSVGNYFATSGNVIPKNLAVEISPLLLNKNVSLAQYNRNKFLYRLRVSFGTSSLNNGSYSVAEGIRLTIMDKTDLRTNQQLNNFFNSYLSNKTRAIEQAEELYSQQNHISINDLHGQLDNNDTLQQKINTIALRFLSDKDVDINALSKYRDSIKQTLWNASIWEIGIATSQTSTDSLVKNLKFSQIGFWNTAGLPLGKKGQLLIGAKIGFIDSVKWQTQISIGERIYYGNNNFKGFIQGQYDYKNNSNNFTSSLGCQFNIMNGIWGEFALNLVLNSSGQLSYQPGFNIALATPEKKH